MTLITRPRSDIGPLAAIVAGAGPAVLLIHGVGLQAEAWNGQIDALSKRCRVIAVDLPGHGQSDAFSVVPTLADYTDRIAGTLQGPAVVIGHSFGAMIALDLAVRYPDLVQGVAALNAIYQRDDAAQLAVRNRADSLDGVTTADPTQTLARWFGTTTSPERDACANWLRGVDPQGYRAAYRTFAYEDGPQAAQLAQLHCPALFLTGADEPNSTPQMSEKMAQLCPKGQAMIVASAAHMLPMTHAAQVNEILGAFIQDVQNTTEGAQ